MTSKKADQGIEGVGKRMKLPSLHGYQNRLYNLNKVTFVIIIGKINEKEYI